MPCEYCGCGDLAEPQDHGRDCPKFRRLAYIYEDDLAELRAENARLRKRVEGLERVEWVPLYIMGYCVLCCPWCRQHKAEGHAPDCSREEGG
jgi:hypothetical protein